jgi:hypothetical protein
MMGVECCYYGASLCGPPCIHLTFCTSLVRNSHLKMQCEVLHSFVIALECCYWQFSLYCWNNATNKRLDLHTARCTTRIQSEACSGRRRWWCGGLCVWCCCRVREIINNTLVVQHCEPFRHQNGWSHRVDGIICNYYDYYHAMPWLWSAKGMLPGTSDCSGIVVVIMY